MWNQRGDFSLDWLGIACTSSPSRYIAFDSDLKDNDKISSISFSRADGGDLLSITCVPEHLQDFKDFMKRKGFIFTLFAEDIHFNNLDKATFNRCLQAIENEFDPTISTLNDRLNIAFDTPLIGDQGINDKKRNADNELDAVMKPNKTLCYSPKTEPTPKRTTPPPPHKERPAKKPVRRALDFGPS